MNICIYKLDFKQYVYTNIYMKIKRIISVLFVVIFSSLLFAEATSEEMTPEEKKIVERFETFKQDPSRDSFEKWRKSLEVKGNIRNQNVKNILEYYSAIKKLDSVRITFKFFEFGEGFANKYEDNRIRIYVNKDLVLNLGDIKTNSGNILENSGKYNWVKGEPSWSQKIDGDNISFYFENFIFWGSNSRSKFFELTKYQIFALSCETGAFEQVLEDKNQNASITLKFSNLPKLEK